ncbi:MAG: hypothetical protein ACRD0Z_10295 [Acidimicrobiales bacterium]
MEQEESLFGKPEAAALLAVEDANGGELADIGQVLAAYQYLFGRWPEAARFAQACGLLHRAGLVECRGRAVGLTPRARKLLRRSGRPGSAHRPEAVTSLLEKIAGRELASANSGLEPSEDKVADALTELAENPELVGELRPAPPAAFSFLGFELYGGPSPPGDIPEPYNWPEPDGNR